jgi:hypothetical protein
MKRSGRDESIWVVIYMHMEAMLGISLYSSPYLSIVKMSTLPKVIHRFNTITVNDIPYKTRKSSSKIYIAPQIKSKVAKAILSRMNKAGGITLPDFKTYYKVCI